MKHIKNLDDFKARTSLSPSGCWEWLLFRQPSGYGRSRYKTVCKMAHRLAYELFIGPIPEGLEIDHLCRNRGCVNPDHLEPVTHAENRRRGAAARVACKYGHPYVPGSFWLTGRNERICKACTRERAQRRKFAKNS